MPNREEVYQSKNVSLMNLFGEEIVRVESFTRKGKFYEVNKRLKTCTCPAFQRGKTRPCKHLKMVLGIKDGSSGFSLSLLKSGLQKAVRRGDAERAVMCAKIHLQKNPNDFWRRLPIVIVEDVILHPKYREIVELASKSARKDYELTDEEMKFGLEIVEQMARCEVRDVEFMEILHGRVDDKYGEFMVKELGEEEKSLVMALKWRAGMGGMKSDIRMLNILYKIWIDRFLRGMSVNDLYKFFPKPKINYKDLPDSESASMIMLEAVDFHCSPLLSILLRKRYVVEKIKGEFNLKNIEDVKKYLMDIVWRMRSAVNYKIDIFSNKQFNWLDAWEYGVYDKNDSEKYIKIYNLIKVEIDNISRWFINKLLKNNF